MFIPFGWDRIPLDMASDFKYLQQCAEAIKTPLFQTTLLVHRVKGHFWGQESHLG